MLLRVSGVVLAGVGPNTILSATEAGFAALQRYVLVVGGNSAGSEPSGRSAVAAAEVAIIDSSRVPVGATTFTVADGSSFSVGDDIIVEARATAAGIVEIGMDEIPTCDVGSSPSCRSWESDDYIIQFRRVISAVDGNSITVDLPLTQAIRPGLWTGSVYKYICPGCIAKVGVRVSLHTKEIFQL